MLPRQNLTPGPKTEEEPEMLTIYKQERDKPTTNSKMIASALQTKEQAKFDKIIGEIFEASQLRSTRTKDPASHFEKSITLADFDQKTVEEDALDLEAKLLRFKREMEYEPSMNDSIRLSSLKGFRGSPGQWRKGQNLLQTQTRARQGKGRHMFRTMDEGFVKRVVNMGRQRFGDTISLAEEEEQKTYQWRKERVKGYGRVGVNEMQRSNRELRRKSGIKRRLFKDWMKQKKMMMKTLDKLDPNNITVLVKENEERRGRKARGRGKRGKLAGSQKGLLKRAHKDRKQKREFEGKTGLPRKIEVESRFTDLKLDNGGSVEWKGQKLFPEIDPALLGSIDQAVLENIRSRGKKGLMMSFDKDLNLEADKSRHYFYYYILLLLNCDYYILICL